MGEEKSDLRVVLQFFIVPLALVAVLVSVFFGLQFLRGRTPDPRTTLGRLERYEGFLAAWIGDLKRWQHGYDLSVLLRDPAAAAVVPELARAFREAGERGDVPLRRYLALALGRSADPGAAAPLRAGLADADPQIRLFCVWGLMTLGERAAVPDLRAAVADPDPGVRKAAIFALGEFADAESAPALIGALADVEPDVGWNAALALARLGRTEAAPVLVRLLEASAFAAAAGAEPAARERALNAIRGLALLGPGASRPLLQRVAAGAADQEVRRAARLALEAPPGPPAR
jgi:HEAT repeat protein